MGTASTRDLIEDFQEQWRFLHSSMRGYDEGDFGEAKRIAVQIRTFVHDTSASTSLLKRMGIKDQLQYFASGGGVSPDNAAGTTSLTGLVFTSGPDGGQAGYVSHSPYDIVEWYESGNTDLLQLASFDDWWTSPVIKDTESNLYSRQDLVLMAANRDGGAHVDNLKPHEAALKGGLNYGWGIETEDEDGQIVVYGPDKVLFNPTAPSIRTIANELDLTFHGHSESVLGFEFDGTPYKPWPRSFPEEEAAVTYYKMEVRHYDDDGNETGVETLL